MKLQKSNFQPAQWFSFAWSSSFFCLLTVFCGLTNLHAAELPLDVVVVTDAEVDPFIEGYHDVETFQIVLEKAALKVALKTTPKTVVLRSKNPFTQVAAAPKAIQKSEKSKSKGPLLFLQSVSENKKSPATKTLPAEGWRQSKISAKAAVLKRGIAPKPKKQSEELNLKNKILLDRMATRNKPFVKEIVTAPKKQIAPVLLLPIVPKTLAELAAEQGIPQAMQRPFTRSELYLRNKLRRVLKTYAVNPQINSRDRTPWEIMHSVLAFEKNSKIHQEGPRGPLVTAVGWLCYNRPCKGKRLLRVSNEGTLITREGPGLQGHKGQLLSMLAQAKVSENYPIEVDQRKFTIRDLIEAEKLTCYQKSELTFKLIGLSYYLPSDAQWVNEAGMVWDVPTLIREEMAQPIRGVACGGTHRLIGLSLAVKNRELRSEPMEGEYLRAKVFIEKYQRYAFKLQNRDGSFSTSWFRGRGEDDDLDRRLKTTGHTLEWLVYSLPEKSLRNRRTFAAVNHLTTMLYNNSRKEWEVSPLGHAVHALVLYDQRVFKPLDQYQRLAKAFYQKQAAAKKIAEKNRTNGSQKTATKPRTYSNRSSSPQNRSSQGKTKTHTKKHSTSYYYPFDGYKTLAFRRKL